MGVWSISQLSPPKSWQWGYTAPCILVHSLKTIDMAIARFHSLRGEKSALIGVKANAFVFGWSHVYVPKVAIPNVDTITKGTEFFIPDGFKLVDMINPDGNIATTKEGEPLKVLSY